MSETKHDGPYTVREFNSHSSEVLDANCTYVIRGCSHGLSRQICDHLNAAYHAGRDAGRADLLRELGVGDWLPKVGDQVQIHGGVVRGPVDGYIVGVGIKGSGSYRLEALSPYVRPLEVGETVRTFDGVIGRLLAVCDDVGVIWDAEHKVSVDEPIGKLTRVD